MRKIILAAALSLSACSAHGEARLVGDLPHHRPLQNIDGLETEYGQVKTSEGTRLRTILTRPAGTTGKLPAIFLTQWVSCDSIDFGANSPSPFRELAQRSGLVFMRVDRSGTGDSEGTPCSKLDYDTEVRQYREALDQLTHHPWVDPNRIIVMGSSLGSTTAPLVAQGRNLAGIIVQGGGAETYLERMINFDRLYLERSGNYRPDQIQGEMLKRIPFQYEYLVRGKTPQQVEAEHPELKGVAATIRGLEADNQYGRPFAWHQQAAKQDFLTAWTKIDAPVLVLYGEYDQFETREGHQLIADTVNSLKPGTATFVEIPHASHDMVWYPDAVSAYREQNGKMDNGLFLTPVLAWLKKVVP